MSRDEASVIVRAGGNSVSLRNCTLQATPAPPPPAGPHAPAVQAQVASAVRLEAVTFAGYGLVYLLLDSQGTSHFFSDEEILVWDERLEDQRTTRSLAEAASVDVFLTMEDEWIRDLLLVCAGVHNWACQYTCSTSCSAADTGEELCHRVQGSSVLNKKSFPGIAHCGNAST